MPALAAPVYSESVRAAVWFYFAVSTPLGAVLGIMTGVAVAGLIEGAEAVAFYIGMSVLALLLLLFMVNFTNLSIRLSNRSLEFAFGLFRKQLQLTDIKAVEVADYRWMEYGGWGIRFALGGKRAWSVPGARRGVAVRVMDRDKDRLYFISSYRPEALADSLRAALSPVEHKSAPRTSAE